MNARSLLSELRRMFPLQWEMTRGYRLPTRELGEPYFISWSPAPRPVGEGWDNAPFATDGVIDINTFRNPVQIAQYALYQYALAHAGDDAARERFLAQARYLASAQRDDGGYEYPISLPAYSAKPGFLSCMPQGEVASVLLRAFALTRGEHFLERGLRSLAPLRRDLADGGASYVRGGDTFYEEVAAEPACHILNGHLYADFGVWEYVTHGFADDDLVRLHRDAVETLDRWIERFDADGWSCYDLAVDDDGRRHFAPLWYHQFHIAQLRVYSAMTGNEKFGAIAERWNRALNDAGVRGSVWAYNAGSLARAVRRRVQRRPVAAFRPQPN